MRRSTSSMVSHWRLLVSVLSLSSEADAVCEVLSGSARNTKVTTSVLRFWWMPDGLPTMIRMPVSSNTSRVVASVIVSRLDEAPGGDPGSGVATLDRQDAAVVADDDGAGADAVPLHV
jgi:hypothetical protein